MDVDREENNIILYDDNRVSFCGYITSENISSLISALTSCIKEQPLTWDDDEKPKIYLHIDSPGGCLYSGLKGYDAIKQMARRVDIITIAEGQVCSAATLLFLAGSKRCAMPNVWFLFHQLSAGMYGKNKDIQDEATNCKRQMKQMIRIYSDESNICKNDIKRLLLKEVNLSARQAKHWGFVHKVFQ